MSGAQENVETVRQFIKSCNERDLSAALMRLDTDIEWIGLRVETEGIYHGHEGFRRFWADTEESWEIFDLRFEFQDLGDGVLAWGTIHVRGRASGVEMDVATGGVFDFRGGRIVRWHDFGSKEKALEAVRLRD